MSSISAINALNETLNSSTSSAKTNDVNFSSYLSTTKSLEDIFTEASNTYGVSVSLLKAIAKQESNFDPNATSRSGAQGIMQLMPATAASLGVTNSYDPYQNILGGAKYISEKLTAYNGDISLALAAYNAGSNNVAKYGGIPPFEETQNYVVKVTNYMNENIAVPSDSYSVNSTLSNDSAVSIQDLNGLAKEILDHIFSYEDYLTLISSLLQENKTLSLDILTNVLETSTTKEEEDTKQDEALLAYQTLKNPSLYDQLLAQKVST